MPTHPAVRAQLPPHRDDGVALALLGQVPNATQEEPVGGDVGLAGLDHATAQFDQLWGMEGATFTLPPGATLTSSEKPGHRGGNRPGAAGILLRARPRLRHSCA